MKRKMTAFLIMAMALVLVSGCAMEAGLSIEIDPDPIVFTGPDDLVDATVKITTTGMGELTVSGFSAMLTGTKGDKTLDILSIDTDDENIDFEPITTPAVGGMSKEIQVQEYLAEDLGQEVTVATLIAELPDDIKTEYEINTYEDLKAFDGFLLKVNIDGSNPTTKEVEVQFN